MPLSKDRNIIVPQEELDRQMEFCGLVHTVLETRLDGRKPLAYVHTFGCQGNVADSERLNGLLEKMGFGFTEEPENADISLFNTCAVREHAEDRLFGNVGALKKIKEKNPDFKIILCGCMMQEPLVVEKLKKSYHFVNLIFGTHNIYRFAEYLVRCMTEDRRVIDIWKDTDKIVENLPVDRKYPFKSGINIMFGCNNFCSYCIVPYVRGRERSREPEEIIKEIKELVADGVVEIMLLGQNVNSYGKNLEHPITFAQLLKQVDEIEGLERIRFMTSHPKDLSDELIDVMTHSKKVCRQLHLPLQSGSSRLLKIMNRHYTKESYLELVAKIKKAMPDIALTTDIIVGFPGETEEEFKTTCDFAKKVSFAQIHVFKYSRRHGTVADRMEDQVDEQVKNSRSDRLLAIEAELEKQYQQKFPDQTQKVLIEEPVLIEGTKYLVG